MKSITKKIASRVSIFLLAGAAALGAADNVGAFSTGDGASFGGGLCTFSEQLQTSVSVRREYLVKLDQALGGTYTAQNDTVDGMYGNIVLAAYDEDDAATVSIFNTSGRNSASLIDMDSFSKDCLSCHDGAAASMIEVDLRDRPNDRHSWVATGKSDHPIGMTYNNYVAANRGYKPVSGNKMVFVNGKVGCLSCHDPLNAERGHLVMSDVGSALCKTCHDK